MGKGDNKRIDALAEFQRLRQGFEKTEWVRAMNGMAGAYGSCIPLVEAFKYFDIDPTDQSHRDALLYVLACVAFSSTPAPGRPKGSHSWDEDRLFLLGLHHHVVTSEIPGMSDAQAAKEIKLRFPDYRHDTPETIRQRLPETHDVMESVLPAIEAARRGKIKL